MADVKKYTTMKQYNSPLASRLRELAEHSGKSVKTIASEIGITRQSLSGYLNGNNEPQASTICKIASYFGVSSDYLLGIDSANIDDNMQVLQCHTGLSIDSINTILSLNRGVKPLFGEAKTKRINIFERVINDPEFLPLLDSIHRYVYDSKQLEDKEYNLFQLQRQFIKMIDGIDIRR